MNYKRPKIYDLLSLMFDRLDMLYISEHMTIANLIRY